MLEYTSASPSRNMDNLQTVTLAASTSIVSTTSSVMLNNMMFEPYGNLGSESSVMVTTLDFENGIRMDEHWRVWSWR